MKILLTKEEKKEILEAYKLLYSSDIEANILGSSILSGLLPGIEFITEYYPNLMGSMNYSLQKDAVRLYTKKLRTYFWALDILHIAEVIKPNGTTTFKVYD